jgi:hypothetical protein
MSTIAWLSDFFNNLIDHRQNAPKVEGAGHLPASGYRNRRSF